ncbi:MFS transporter [Nocardia brasiliensis]
MSYRRLATRDVLAWSIVSLAGKLPIAMAPLGLVFLVRSAPGGYALGAVLSAGYVLGEVIGAAVQGMWLRQHRIRPQLAAGFAVGAAAFAGLAVSGSAPAPLLIGLAFLAGFGPAGSPGGMRSMLIGLVTSPDVPRALGVEAMLTQVIWAAAPALVVSLATGLFPAAPLTLAAIGAAAAAVLIFLLPGQAAATVVQTEGGWRTVLSGWPIYLTSAAAMSLLATAELVLPALLEFRGIEVRWAGPMLTAFAVTGAVGAFCYGLREWPGTVRVQALVLLVVTASCVALVAITPGLGIAVALAAAGLFQAAVIVARNLALRAQLPAHLHAAAYSVMYAVGGIGYGLAATVSALVLAHTAPSSAILGGVVITLALTAISALAERFAAAAAKEPVRTAS